MDVRIGTAGWAIPRTSRDSFPQAGSTLERYAARLTAAEINSSFYKPHRTVTYERWAAQVPDAFRFAVKAPREVSHNRRLADCAEPLAQFHEEIAGLGGKLGPVLLQLPPSFVFEAAAVDGFLSMWRARFEGAIVCEPRHPTWFEAEADRLLAGHQIARVAADPAPVPAAAKPGGWSGLRYWRLHGSPRMYSSPYEPEALTQLARNLADGAAPAWCVFDNTMHAAAARNALELASLVSAS